MLNDERPALRAAWHTAAYSGRAAFTPAHAGADGAVSAQGCALSALHRTPRPHRERHLTFQALRRYGGPVRRGVVRLLHALFLSPLLCRVRPRMNLLQRLYGHLRVDLRRLQLLMAEDRLDVPRVRAVVQHLCGH